MRNLIEKLRVVERKLARQHGAFRIFACLSVVGGNGYDIVVAADWIDDSPAPSFELVALAVAKALSEQDFEAIGTLVAYTTDEWFVKSMNNSINIEHGSWVIEKVAYGDVVVDSGYVITSQSLASATVQADEETKRPRVRKPKVSKTTGRA